MKKDKNAKNYVFWSKAVVMSRSEADYVKDSYKIEANIHGEIRCQRGLPKEAPFLSGIKLKNKIDPGKQIDIEANGKKKTQMFVKKKALNYGISSKKMSTKWQ
jgi:hypothetical protein